MWVLRALAPTRLQRCNLHTLPAAQREKHPVTFLGSRTKSRARVTSHRVLWALLPGLGTPLEGAVSKALKSKCHKPRAQKVLVSSVDVVSIFSPCISAPELTFHPVFLRISAINDIYFVCHEMQRRRSALLSGVNRQFLQAIAVYHNKGQKAGKMHKCNSE